MKEVRVATSDPTSLTFARPSDAKDRIACQQGHFVVKSDPFFLSESLGVERECNREKKVAYVLRFRDPKSLGAHSGDRSFCVFAYLTVLLGGHFPILQYLIALLEGYFQNRWEPIVSAMSKTSGICIAF